MGTGGVLCAYRPLALSDGLAQSSRAIRLSSLPGETEGRGTHLVERSGGRGLGQESQRAEGGSRHAFVGAHSRPASGGAGFLLLGPLPASVSGKGVFGRAGFLLCPASSRHGLSDCVVENARWDIFWTSFSIHFLKLYV